MKEGLKFGLEVLKMVVLALVIVLPIRYFLFQPFVVSGSSMAPSFRNGDYLLIDEISYRFREPKRGEVIIFRAPPHPSSRYIKRIVGLPGETVKLQGEKVVLLQKGGERILKEPYLDEEIRMRDQEMVLKEGEYFVMGDNRSFSSDSRNWGPLSKKNIVGRAFFRALPLSRAEKISLPSYELEKAGLFALGLCFLQ